MVVSSNALFQFTKSNDTIIKILQSGGFWPRYCIEFGWYEKWRYDFAVPQCCFCDIPLSAITNHINFYGSYGIGMSKEWGIKNGLSPVMYVIPNSHFIKTLNGIRKAAKNSQDNIRMLAFIKRYKGVNYRKDEKGKWKQYKDYFYYNEREWRYVPESLPASSIVVKVDNKESFKIDELSKKTFSLICHFSASDVKYLLVNTDEERIELIKEISYMTNWTEEEKSLLSSIIITKSLITEDI